MTGFHGPLTSPAFIQAGHGRIAQNGHLELKTDRENGTLLAAVDLVECHTVTAGNIQQAHHWEIVLHFSSVPYASGSKLRTNNLANLRRKSSIGAPRAVERLSHTTAITNSPSITASTSASSSSKSALWLKSKFRSKSISAANAASLAMTYSASSTSPQQPLPDDASAIIAKNAAISPTTETPSRRPTSAKDSSTNHLKTKPSSTLVLSTISRELQLQWIEALSIAISACAKQANPTPAQGGMSTSSSLPTLAVHASPSTQVAADLTGYAFPRKPSPSPLRMTTVTNQAILSSQPAAPSPTTSFLELGRSSSSRSSTPCSFTPGKSHEGESPCTAVPSPTASAHRQALGSPNPLLPQWLSDLRRNSGGSILDGVQGRYSSRSPSPAPSSQTIPKMPTASLLERPSMRQSKSSSFLNLDPRRERTLLSPPIGHLNSPFPDRGIKISIHPDEEEEQHPQHFQRRHLSSGLSASQPARARRSSARSYDVSNDRPSTPPIYISSALSSHNSSTQDLGIHFDAKISTSSENLLRPSQYGNYLRPSLSSTSLSSSNAASSLCGGGESVSLTAQSLDPPTPCPPFVEHLGTPESCELTPTCLPEGNSKRKLQGYFGVPQEIVDNQKALQSPSLEMKPKTHKQNNKSEVTGYGRIPFHARFGAVFSSASQRTPITSPTLTSPEDKDKESIKSTTSSVSMSNSSSHTSRQSVTSPISSHVDSASTSRKSSSDLPSNVKTDVGRHIIDPAELRRLMQERLDSSTSSSPSSHHIRNVGRSGVAIGGTGMKKSVSMQAAIDSYARSPTTTNINLKGNLSASINTSPNTIEYQKYTFGKAHPAQAPSFSPVEERFACPISSTPLNSSSFQYQQQQHPRMLPRSESANSVNVQALFAALPPPKRRSAGPVRPSTANGAAMPTFQEAVLSHLISN